MVLSSERMGSNRCLEANQLVFSSPSFYEKAWGCTGAPHFAVSGVSPPLFLWPLGRWAFLNDRIAFCLSIRYVVAELWRFLVENKIFGQKFSDKGATSHSQFGDGYGCIQPWWPRKKTTEGDGVSSGFNVDEDKQKKVADWTKSMRLIGLQCSEFSTIERLVTLVKAIKWR